MTLATPSRPPLAWHHPAALLATFGGIGLLPRAPGTWGSLAALPIAWVLREIGGAGAVVAAALALFIAGCWAAGRYSAALGRADPGSVVIDEVAAQLLVLLPVRNDPLTLGVGFFLFRVFDIVKPWPVRLADRRIKGGIGIMLDDVLAAIYAGVLLYLFAYLTERL